MENKNQTPATLSSITQFSFFNPEQFATMQRVAKMFANSALVPDMYRISANNPEDKATANCVLAIDIANRIEANILMVMQNLVIIYGKPTWSSKFLIGTVNTCGRYEPLKFRFEKLGIVEKYKYTEYETNWSPSGKKSVSVVEKTFTGPVDDLQCIAYTTERGSKDLLESPPVNVRMAIDEGWYTKKGSKWPNMTKLMLMYRAASFWTNTYAPDLSLGMKTAEEMHDIIDIEAEDVTPTVEKKVEEEIKKEANQQVVDISDDEPQPTEQKPEKEKEPKTDDPDFEIREAERNEVKDLKQAQEYLVRWNICNPEDVSTMVKTTKAIKDSGIEFPNFKGPAF